MAQFQRTWENRRRKRGQPDAAARSYYNIPPIHKPHWKWLVIVYFFAGGIAGMSYVVATIAQLLGGQHNRSITRAGRYISLVALLPSPVLLILDLGRPDRFHHMLRILKLRSPMSVGTWTLTIFGAFCGLSALIQAAEDGLLRRVSPISRPLLALPPKLIGALGLAFAFGTSGYTGILVSATAVPLWARNYLLMGPLFLASSLSNAVAAIRLVLSFARGTSQQTHKRLEQLELTALLAELGLLLAARINLGPVLDKPLRDGHLGRVYRGLVLGAGISAPLLLSSAGRLLHHRWDMRAVTPLSALLTLVGGQAFRYLIVMAGRASADDPQATFAFTREQ